LAPIARGGAATVYLGRALGLGGFSRMVAIKLLHPHLLEDASSQAAHEFIEEAKLSALLQHPMIVPVIDVGQADEGFFLVMDYIDGASLSEILCRKNQLPQRIALKIIYDVLQGLHAAHTARDDRGRPLSIVHRDYSPQNILVGADGRSRLTDFGIARATTRAEYTRTGLVKGKVAYMSPEQGEGRPLDLRTDVWAAGVVAWEMFAGRRMYPGLEPMPMLLRITTGEAPSLRKVNPQISAALDNAVHGALVRERRERYSSALELRDAIVEAAGGRSEVASDEEVGDFVEGLQIERLIRLRALVHEATETDLDSAVVNVLTHKKEALPGRADREVTRLLASPSTGQTVLYSATNELPSESSRITRTTTAIVSEEDERPASRRVLAFLAIALALLAASLAFTLLRRSELTTRSPSAPALPQTDAQETLAPTVPVTPAPPAPTSDIIEPGQTEVIDISDLPEEVIRTELHIAANAPLKGIQVGKRSVILLVPAPDVSVLLTEEEQGTEVRVQATAVDGRKAQRIVPITETSVTIEFGEKRPVVQQRPRPPAPPKSPPRANSDLEASPY
jgi:serine/threonine-protein kinase